MKVKLFISNVHKVVIYVIVHTDVILTLNALYMSSKGRYNESNESFIDQKVTK